MRQLAKKSISLLIVAALFLVVFHKTKEFLSQVLDPNSYKEEISRQIEQAVGKKVTIGSASVKFTSGIGIELGSVRVFETEGGKNFFSADSIIAVVRVAPLFKKQVLLKKIILNHPVFLENIEFQSGGDSSWKKAAPILAGAAQFQIRDGEWALAGDMKEEGTLAGPVRFDLVVKESLVGDAPYVFTLQGRLKYPNQEKGSFKLDGEILRLPNGADPLGLEFSAKINGKNINEAFLSRLDPRMSRLAKYLPGSLDFDASISGVPSKKLQMQGSVGYNSQPGIYTEDSSRFHLANLKFSALYQDQSLFFEKMDMVFDNVKMGGKLEIKDLGAESPSVNLNWEVNPVPFSLLKENFFWKAALPEKAKGLLQDSFRGGKIHVQSILYDGPWAPLAAGEAATVLDYLSLRLAVEGVEGFLSGPGAPLPFTEGFGQVLWEKKKLSMEDIRMKVMGTSIENLRGGIFPGEKLKVEDINGKLKLNLAESSSLLSRLTGWGVISPPLLKTLQDVASTTKGTAEVDFKVDGESGSLKTTGSVRFAQISFRVPYAGIVPEKVMGRLRFDETALILEDVAGEAAGMEFSISGKIQRYLNGKPEFQLDAHLKGDGESLKAIATKNVSVQTASWLKKTSLSGPLKLKLALKGGPGRAEIDSFLDLTSAGFQYEDSLTKEKGKECSLLLSGRYGEGKPFFVRRYEFSYMGDVLEGDIFPPVAGAAFPHIRFNSKKFHIKNLMELLATPCHPSLAGHLAVQMGYSGKKTRNGHPFLQGELRLENFGYQFQELPVPLKETSGRFKINGEHLTLDSFTIKYKDSEVILSGTYEDVESPKYELKLDSPRFQMDDIMPLDPITILWLRDFLSSSNRFRRANGKIFIDVRDGDFKFLRWRALTGTLTIKDKAFYLTDAVAPFSGGELHGSGNIGFLSQKGMDFLLNLKVVSAPSREVMAILGPSFDESVEGNFSFSSSIGGEGYNWEEVRRSLYGQMALLIKDGSYSKQKLLRGVRGIFDLKESGETQKAEPPKEFYRLGGKFVLKDGIAETDNFFIFTKARKTTMMGKILLGEKALDLSVGVAPWAQADKILSQIPLVGSILAGGDDKSLLVSYYEIKGDMADPKVEALPLKSIGKKFEGMIKGLFQTPQDIQDLLAPQRSSKK